MTVFAYEWASLALLLTILFIFSEYRRLKVKRTKLFLIFMQVSIASDIINIGYTYIQENSVALSPFFAEGWTILHFMLSTSITPVFAIYLYELVAKEEWSKYYLAQKLIFIPQGILAILLVFNCFYHFLFEYTDGVMEMKMGQYIFDYLPLAYMLFVMLVSTINRDRFTKHHFRILCVYVMASATIFLIAYLSGLDVVGGIATGLTAIFAYIYVENPETYTDEETKLFNLEGFQIYSRNQYLHKLEFHCVMISLSNYKTINILTNKHTMESMIQDFKKWCVELSNETSVFRISPSVFVISTNREVIANGVYEKIKQQLKMEDDERLINKLGGNVFLVQNCIQFEKTEELLRRFFHMAEYVDPVGKKNYFRNNDIEQFLNREIAVEEAVRKAIIDESFEMYYQPVYNVKKQIFDKAEALIRLNDPVLGFIPPDEFITLAEQRGLIRKITRLVIRKTIHAIKERNLKELGVESININLSTRDMWEGDLKQFLPSVMEEEGIDPSMVTLEITETAASGNREIASDFMNKMVSLGYKFAVDDYGTGYSNIERAISLPFDSVKIDKSLFYLSTKQEKFHYLLEHTIMIFHDMGFKVVVEGAETKQHVDSLCEMKTDYIQGYYYSKPLPLKEYEEFLVKHRKIE